MTTRARPKAEPAPTAEFDYPWIRAWGAYIDATRPMIEETLELARAEQRSQTTLWYVNEMVWDENVRDVIPREYWMELKDLMHGQKRQPQVTDQRMFLWDWGMAREIHIPDQILRDWLGEVIPESSSGRW